MNEKIFKIISEISKKSISEIETNKDEKGLWDSFSHVELIIALETEFNVFFEQEEIAEMNTPTRIIEYIGKKVL
jgi:acyl carrier protein